MQEELDELCEAFLDEKFDVRIDFAIEESMPRLRMYGLVDAMPDADDPRVKAPDLEVVHGRLIKRWQRCDPPHSPASAVPPCRTGWPQPMPYPVNPLRLPHRAPQRVKHVLCCERSGVRLAGALCCRHTTAGLCLVLRITPEAASPVPHVIQ